jgi:beta-lactamase class A
MDPNVPLANWCTPRAMMQLLEQFHRGQLLSDSSKSILWKAMIEGPSGRDRIKGALPAGTPVAHKTGTSSTDEKTGITPALNDVGIVQLPDGRYIGIAVFIADSAEPADANAGIIAQISKTAWDYFLKKP